MRVVHASGTAISRRPINASTGTTREGLPPGMVASKGQLTSSTPMQSPPGAEPPAPGATDAKRSACSHIRRQVT